MSREYLRKEEVLTLWGQIVDSFCSQAQASVLASGIGQAMALAQDNAENIVLHDGRIGELESYFDGSSVKEALHAAKATNDGDGNAISSTYLKLAGGTMTGDLKLSSSSKIVGIDSLSNEVNLFQYTSNDVFRIGYGQVTKNALNIYGKSVNIRANGLTDSSSDAYIKVSEGGTVTVKGALSVLNDASFSGTLAVTGDITCSSNIQAAGGVAANGLVDLGSVDFSKYSKKFVVSSTTMSSNNIFVSLTTDAPTYQVVDTGDATSVSIRNNTGGYSEYYGYQRYMRFYNSSQSNKTITINWSVVCESDNVTLPPGSYVEIMFFHPASDERWIAKWSSIMTYQ